MGILIVLSFKDYSTKIMKTGFTFFETSIIDVGKEDLSEMKKST